MVKRTESPADALRRVQCRGKQLTRELFKQHLRVLSEEEVNPLGVTFGGSAKTRTIYDEDIMVEWVGDMPQGRVESGNHL